MTRDAAERPSPVPPEVFEAYALRYGTRDGTRGGNFYTPPAADGPMPLAYYVWVLRAAGRVVLVDTGFSEATAHQRSLRMERNPVDALGALGIAAADVNDLILTHLHDDHAGNVDRVSDARVHVQDDEMAYATGRYMAHPACGGHYARADVHVLVDRAFDGRITFHRGDAVGDAAPAPGLTLHRVSGHTAGLQCVRAWTRRGWLVLASDATHFYENLEADSPYREVIDVRAALDGFAALRALAGASGLIVPGHDPAVMTRFPRALADHDFIVRLD